MSIDDTATDSAAVWRAVSEGSAGWGDWVESRLTEQRHFLEEVFAEVLVASTNDLRDELNKAIANLRAQRSLSVVGTYSGDTRYRMLDVVATGGASFCAKRDDPGVCPGDDWQLIASQGKKGNPGRDGVDGKPGRDAPRIERWLTNCENFTAVPIMSDGSRGAPLELRALFERYNAETT
jgi:hypothetical protein